MLFTSALVAAACLFNSAEAFTYVSGKKAVGFAPYFGVDVMDSTDQSIYAWFPTDKSKKYPLLSFAHGSSGGGLLTVPGYGVILSQIAAFGYVVIAHAACDTGCEDEQISLGGEEPENFGAYYKEQLKAIEWAKGKVAAGDDVFKRVNLDAGVGVLGHSMGGQSSLFSSSLGNNTDSDIRAAALLYPFSTVYPKLDVPSMILTGELDETAPDAQARAMFAAASENVDRVFVNRVDGTHQSPSLLDFDPKIAQYVASWFKLHLDGLDREPGFRLFSTNYKDLVYGDGFRSLCSGGYGDVSECYLRSAGEPAGLN